MGSARKAQKWDQISWAAWLDRNTLSKPAHDLLERSIAGLYTSAASEVSLLFVLYQMASAGGPSFVLGVKDAAEDARPGRRHGRHPPGGRGRARRRDPPVAAGAQHRPERRRGDRPFR